MNKILTVISLLFIVAYANCTKKVSYSEIVSSLAQVSHVEGAEPLIDATATTMAESLEKLGGFQAALNNQCASVTKRGSAKAAAFAASIKASTDSIVELNGDNVRLTGEINDAVAAQEGNQKNAENLRDELKTDAGVLQDKTMAIVERKRVLRRMLNLVQDELAGTQRDSTVGDFHVDKKLSGFSFVEVHNQLKELDSHDPIVKSMITTLILITQDKKNLFANQENVGKIAAMIEEIIKKDMANGQKLRESSADKATEIHKTLSELADTMNVQMNTIAEKRATIVSNHRIVGFSMSEQNGLEAAAKRAATRQANNEAMCKKVHAHFNRSYGDFLARTKIFADLKKLVV